jgi:hypothetical protein
MDIRPIRSWLRIIGQAVQARSPLGSSARIGGYVLDRIRNQMLQIRLRTMKHMTTTAVAVTTNSRFTGVVRVAENVYLRRCGE